MNEQAAGADVAAKQVVPPPQGISQPQVIVFILCFQKIQSQVFFQTEYY